MSGQLNVKLPQAQPSLAQPVKNWLARGPIAGTQLRAGCDASSAPSIRKQLDMEP